MTTLYLIRGLPGCGKSTLARQMKMVGAIEDYFEADQYFIKDGKYVFDANKLKYAHDWCFETSMHHLLGYNQNVAVSNTFTVFKEAKRYIARAKEYGVDVKIITCTTEYGSVHNVPVETMDKMRGRFELCTKEWV